MGTPPAGSSSGGVDISVDGYPVRDIALVVVLCHDGWLMMATEPDADGRSLDPQEAAQCLRGLAWQVEDNPDGEFPTAGHVEDDDR